MKTFIAATAVVGLISGTVVNAQTQQVPDTQRYCAVGAGGMQCTFSTMEECKATFNTGGAGGANCMLNPLLAREQK